MKQLAAFEALQHGRQLLPNNLAQMLTDVVQASGKSIDKERSADVDRTCSKSSPTRKSNPIRSTGLVAPITESA